MAFRLSRHPGTRGADRAGAPGDAATSCRSSISRGAVQLTGVHRRVDRQLAADRRGRGAVERADSSTRCPSACSASRSRRRSCRRCRATRRAPTAIAALRARASTPASRRLAFFVVPSAVAFAALGDVIAGGAAAARALRRRGLALRVGHPRRIVDRPARDDDGAALLGRALRARRREDAAALRARPARASVAALGYVVRDRPAAEARHRVRDWGAAGLTASAGVAGWIEFALLRASLNRRIGRDGACRRRIWRVCGSPALAGAAAGVGRHAGAAAARSADPGRARCCRSSAPRFLRRRARILARCRCPASRGGADGVSARTVVVEPSVPRRGISRWPGRRPPAADATAAHDATPASSGLRSSVAAHRSIARCRCARIRDAGHQHDFRRLRQRRQLVADLEAVRLRHDQVEQHDVGMMDRGDVERLPTRSSRSITA